MKDKYAYPTISNTGPRPGMELRDWFAGMALNGMLAQFMSESHIESDLDNMLYARFAYEHADAMMIEREKSIPTFRRNRDGA